MMTPIRLQHGVGTSRYQIRYGLSLYSINFCTVGLRAGAGNRPRSRLPLASGPARLARVNRMPDRFELALPRRRHLPRSRAQCGMRIYRAQHGTRGPSTSRALVLLAPSTVMSTAGTAVAFGKAGTEPGGNREPGRDFAGPGGFGFPQSTPNCPPSFSLCEVESEGY
jgi:hypothetical protein